MTDVGELAADLRAEQDDLDRFVTGLNAEQWQLDTPSTGWTVADQIGHLTYYDGAATAIKDPTRSPESIQELLASGRMTA